MDVEDLAVQVPLGEDLGFLIARLKVVVVFAVFIILVFLNGVQKGVGLLLETVVEVFAPRRLQGALGLRVRVVLPPHLDLW